MISSRLKQDNGVPLSPPKKFLCGFVRIPGVVLEASGGSNPKPPVASPLAAVAPDDAVEGLKNAAVDCVS
jgi:hypothetical protein